PDSLAPSSRKPNLDAPRRHLGVFLFPHEVDLGRPDIGMASKLADLVHRGPISDGVVDGGLPKRVDADPPAPEPVGVHAGGPAVFLDEPPGGLAIQVPPDEPTRIRGQRPK